MRIVEDIGEKAYPYVNKVFIIMQVKYIEVCV